MLTNKKNWKLKAKLCPCSPSLDTKIHYRTISGKINVKKSKMDFYGDSHSFAKPDLARVTNIHLELRVDFDRKVLVGSALLTIEKLPSITEVILDNYQLVISSVTNASTGKSLKCFVSNHRYGNSFRIQLSEEAANIVTMKILIKYETSPTSSALHWLTPEQTADGIHPFLLTNNKLTFARAVFPCQDTPSVKFKFSATISAPKGLKVLMPADIIDIQEDLTQVVYKFYQDIPIASYGLVIVVGSLVAKSFIIDRRIQVWAEKKFIEKSMRTFANLDRLLMIAERLCGSYIWGTYTICVLPPSISDFEIECPCVTFVSPTLLGGDVWIRPVSEKLSQNWAGHLVTCINYRHWWLKKSFNIFISRKIMNKIFFNNQIDFYISKAFKEMSEMYQNPRYSIWDRRLLPGTSGTLPYESIQYVPYERGYFLLRILEKILGGETVFEPFFKSYFETFKTQSITTEDFITHLKRYFNDKSEIINNIKWDSYFYSTYLLPCDYTEYYNMIRRSSYVVEHWMNCIDFTHICKLVELISDEQKISFLNSVHAFHKILPICKIQAISTIYGFDNQNDEVRFVWLRLCIKSRWEKKVGAALKFAIEFCSPKIACPIFQDLYEWTKMRQITIQTYMHYKQKMLYETQKKLNLILCLN